MENLLMQMTGHQIYDVDEICRVFSEVEQVTNEDLQNVKRNLERQLAKQSEVKYLSSNKDYEKLNSYSKTFTKNNEQSQKATIQSCQTSKSTTLNKRNELKQKLKAQLEGKYQAEKPQNKTPQPQVVKNISLQKVQHKSNESQVQITKKQSQKNQKKSENVGNEIDMRDIFWNSLAFSPSFNSNIIMYYVLILQNVIHSQTQLIKNPKFYQSYQNAVENFIFNPTMENFLQENLIKQRQSLKDVNQRLEREIHFLKITRKSSITGINKSGQVGDSNTDSIDLHKLLTYLINYRHLIGLNEENYIVEKQLLKKKQTQKIKELLTNYKKLIQTETNPNKKTSVTQSKNIDKFQESGKLIEMAIKNKSFINSLRQLYVQSKQSENVNKKKQKVDLNKPQSSSTYKIIESVFETFDQWYGVKNSQKKIIQ